MTHRTSILAVVATLVAICGCGSPPPYGDAYAGIFENGKYVGPCKFEVCAIVYERDGELKMTLYSPRGPKPTRDEVHAIGNALANFSGDDTRPINFQQKWPGRVTFGGK